MTKYFVEGRYGSEVWGQLYTRAAGLNLSPGHHVASGEDGVTSACLLNEYMNE